MTPDQARLAAADRLPERIAFLGFGLIGGSIAAALRDAGCRARLAAWTPDGNGPKAGLERGLLDEAAASADSALDGAGLVVLAGPPLVVISTIEALGDDLRRHVGPDTTVTDVASTKARIVAAAGATDLQFVGGHPMAGRETTGAVGGEGGPVHRPSVGGRPRIEGKLDRCRARDNPRGSDRCPTGRDGRGSA